MLRRDINRHICRKTLLNIESSWNIRQEFISFFNVFSFLYTLKLTVRRPSPLHVYTTCWAYLLRLRSNVLGCTRFILLHRPQLDSNLSRQRSSRSEVVLHTGSQSTSIHDIEDQCSISPGSSILSTVGLRFFWDSSIGNPGAPSVIKAMLRMKNWPVALASHRLGKPYRDVALAVRSLPIFILPRGVSMITWLFVMATTTVQRRMMIPAVFWEQKTHCLRYKSVFKIWACCPTMLKIIDYRFTSS